MFTAMAIVYGVLSMVGYGLANVTAQPLAKKLGPAQLLFLRGFAGAGVLAVGAAATWRPHMHAGQILLALGIGAAGYLPVLAFTQGIRVSRISIVAPVSGTSPLITVLLSFLVLGSPIHTLQWGAIAVVIGANIAMSVDVRNWRNSSIAQLSSGVPFALMAAVGWGCFYFLLVYAAKWLGPWLSAFLVEVGVTLAAGVHLLVSGQHVQLRAAVSRPVIINSLLITLGTIAYAIGVSRYNVGVVAVLSNSTAIVSAVAATYLFHEHLTKKEKQAAAVMIAGVIALTVF